MALTQASEEGLKISNAGTNGQYLQKQSGNTGGLTWADVPAGVGGATGVDFNDNVKIRSGTGNDLEIYHDATNSYITNTTGNLIVKDTTGQIFLQSTIVNIESEDGEAQAKFTADGAVELYYDNSKKFETTSGGAKVNGNTLIIRGGEGETAVLELVSDEGDDAADNWRIINENTGEFKLQNYTGSWETNLKAIGNAGTYLYHNNTAKLWTESWGVSIDGNFALGDTEKLICGGSDDFQIYHSGSNTFFENTTGNVYFRNDGSSTYFQMGSGNEDGIAIAKDDGVFLYFDGTQKFQTTSTGVTVTGNIAVPSGNGIDFSATANSGGTMSNELLDDYEEGTFTPTYLFHSSTGTFGYSTQTGTYTKIGNRVFFSLIIIASSHSGTSSGNLMIAGLPYAVPATTPIPGSCFFIIGGNFTTNYGVALQTNTSERIEFYRQLTSTGANYSAVEASDVALGGLYIKVQGQYLT